MVPNNFTRTVDHSRDVNCLCSVSFFVRYILGLYLRLLSATPMVPNSFTRTVDHSKGVYVFAVSLSLFVIF